ncbi:MAG: radical SAM protein [Candidatus Rokubacteria bacterium]|nr:radical SAM protein [Candidatus Rokubacteria bacterium]
MDTRRLRHAARLARIFWAYRRGKTRVAPLPVRLWIESTSHCNLRCPYCPNKEIARADHGFMDLDLYRRIIDQVADHVYDVNLFHRGEPLIHPRLPEMVAYAKAKGLYTRIHTNVTLLNEKKSRALIESGLDFLSCSFDGYTAQMYEANRVGAKFDWALDHLKAFLRLKRELGARHPFTVLQVMEIGAPRAKAARRQLRRTFLDQLQGLPLDRIILRDPHNWAGDVDTFPELSRDALLADGRRFTPCTFLWYSSTIYWDGTVTACPQDFFAKLGMGDLKEKPLREIWNDARLVELRTRMAAGDIPKELPCYSCDRIWRRSVLGVPTDYLRAFLSDQLMSYGWLRRLARL